jgi:predicted adenylyl cyclase CyaB
MTEIEIKILEINRAQVEEKLRALGAKKVFDGEIHALYYDLPDRRLKSSGIALRLRKEGPKAVLTLKVHVDNAAAKERKELETEVVDFETMRAILEGISFSPWLEMKKHRTSYELQGAHFEIDRYHDSYRYIPEFLEIEGRDMDSIYRHAEALGFSRRDCKPWDAVELAAYYAGKDSGP